MGKIKEFVEKVFDDYRGNEINLKQLIVNLCRYADRNIGYEWLWCIFADELKKQFNERGEIASQKMLTENYVVGQSEMEQCRNMGKRGKRAGSYALKLQEAYKKEIEQAIKQEKSLAGSSKMDRWFRRRWYIAQAIRRRDDNKLAEESAKLSLVR